MINGSSVLISIYQIKRINKSMKNIPEQYINQLQSTLGKLDQALGRIDESIIWLDENGIIAWSNIVFNELTQRIRIEVLGQNINDVIDVSLNNENTPIFNIIKRSEEHTSE